MANEPTDRLDEKEDPERPRRIAREAKGLADVFAAKKGQLAAKVQQYAYSEKTLNTLADSFKDLPDTPLFFEAEKALNKFGAFVRAREQSLEHADYDVAGTTYAFSTVVTANVSVSSAFDFNVVIGRPQPPAPPPGWQTDRFEKCAVRMRSLDSALADTYLSAIQQYERGIGDADRHALLAFRQTWDDLMRLLAPDNAVRGSRFFSRKKGNKPDQISRRERILYAANTHVKRADLVALLEAETDNVLAVYDRLNRLHAPGAIDRDSAHATLLAMQLIIEQWIDAI